MKLKLAGILATVLVSAMMAQAQVKVGDPAPDFSLTGSDGKVHKLSALRGQGVVIAWFPKAFTGGCTAECKSLRENSAGLRGQGVALFAASVDEVEKNKEFAKSLELDYPILSDPTKATAKAYGVLNANGVASRWTFYIGKDGKIAHIDQAVQTSTHGATVVEQAKKLGLTK